MLEPHQAMLGVSKANTLPTYSFLSTLIKDFVADIAICSTIAKGVNYSRFQQECHITLGKLYYPSNMEISVSHYARRN